MIATLYHNIIVFVTYYLQYGVRHPEITDGAAGTCVFTAGDLRGSVEGCLRRNGEYGGGTYPASAGEDRV